VCDEAVLFYPLYALRFADAGLSPAAVSSLFVIWSVTGFVLEIPTGAWADTVSRRRLLAGSALLRGLGFGLWTVWPTYPGFALGFLLWGAHGAVRSGALEALLHDDLAAGGRADRYLAVTGRAQAWATGAMVAATALAGPALAAGGYPLVGAASVAVCVLGALVCLRLPEAPRRVVGPAPDPLAPAGEDPAAGALRGYLAAVRSGVREAATRHGVRRAVLLAALVPGFSALDEYLPLLARADGVSTAWVPALLLLPTAAMAVGSAWAGRRGGTGDRLGPALLLGAVLLAAGASVRHPAGMLPVAGFFGIVQWGQLVAEARLQATITGPARATVLSVAGLGWEVCALAVYAGFALGDRVAAPPALMAVAALAVALTAGYAGRVARGPDRPDRPVPAVAGAPDRVA
jgi:MFS family permease